jgi:hypothetical protein
MLRDKIWAIKSGIKKKIKQRKEYRKWIKQLKKHGVKITKEVKERIKNICNKEN